MMNFFSGALPDAIGQGVLWSMMVLGVYITFRILDVADLTVDGSFSFGGCTCAAFLYNGYNPWFALLMGFVAGFSAGVVTGILHTAFDIPAILAGILTQISLWPINLQVMGSANTSLIRAKEGGRIETLFIKVSEFSGKISPDLKLDSKEAPILVGIIVAIGVIFFMYWFFGTEFGSAIRATGDNENMIKALGVNTKVTKLIALAFSNGLVGLSGALVAQSQKYGDINMGTGAIVIGLAAIVIGEVLLGWLKSFKGKLFAVIVGSIVYFVIRAVALEFDIDPSYMKLISAVIVALALAVPKFIEDFRNKRLYTPDDVEDTDSTGKEEA